MQAGDRIQFRPSYQNARASATIIAISSKYPKWLTIRPDATFAASLLLGNYEMASGLLEINIDLHKVEPL